MPRETRMATPVSFIRWILMKAFSNDHEGMAIRRALH
jgi:hypothetical protein